MSEIKMLKHDPLADAEAILREDFYGRSPREGRAPRAIARGTIVGDDPAEATTAPSKAKPTHYKVVCISLYTRDIENLEATVAELKRRGYTKANKSQLIRIALGQLDIDKLPPPSP
jgi:hypothetical protein